MVGLRRTLAEREAALRDRDARLMALEERQKQTVELCERQVEISRAERDEEVQRYQAEATAAQKNAAADRADLVAGAR